MSPTGCRCLNRRRRSKMNHDLTYMDCWRLIAPLIPNTIDYGQVFVMTFLALQEAEKRRIADANGEKCEKKS